MNLRNQLLAGVLALAALIGGTAHADQLADIKKKGEIVVGVLGTDEPNSFVDPKTRKLSATTSILPKRSPRSLASSLPSSNSRSPLVFRSWNRAASICLPPR
jgi:ABC-type amino acid transport substrate-binding protein